jgi:hypothetical protein
MAEHRTPHARPARTVLRSPDRRSTGRRRWTRVLLAVGALLAPLAAVTAGAPPAQAAPPLAGPFTGVLRADDNSTAAVSATFVTTAGVASGTLFVAPGAILKDCYGAGPRGIGAQTVALSGPLVAAAPSGADQYTLSGSFPIALVLTGPFGIAIPFTDTVNLIAPAATLSPDGSVLTVPVNVAINPPLGLSPCVRTWTIELTGPPVTPFGNIDAVTGQANGTIAVAGWTIDPDVLTTPTDVHVYLDGPWNAATNGVATTANQYRPDVASAFPGAGAAHGFATSIGAAPGPHTVFVYAINTPGTNGLNPLLGVRSVVVPGGISYHVTVSPSSIRLNVAQHIVLTAVDDASGAVVPGTFTIHASTALTFTSGVGRTVTIRPRYDSYYDPEIGSVVKEAICPDITFSTPVPGAVASTGPIDPFVCP